MGEVQRDFLVALGSSLQSLGLSLGTWDPRVGPAVRWLLGARCALGTDFGDRVGD